MAKKLTWEYEMLSCAACGSCGTHIYRIHDEGVGPLLLVDNQNGHDCFSMRVADVAEGRFEAQKHFDQLVETLST